MNNMEDCIIKHENCDSRTSKVCIDYEDLYIIMHKTVIQRLVKYVYIDYEGF